MAKRRENVLDPEIEEALGHMGDDPLAVSDDTTKPIVDIGCWEPVNVGPRSSGAFATSQGYELKRAQNGIEIWKDSRGTLVPWGNIKYVSLTENFRSRPIASPLSSLASETAA